MDRDGDGEDNTERHETIHNGKKFWWDSFFFFRWLYKYSAVYKYSIADMEDHIEKICKTYHFHLTNISKMRTYLDRESTEAIISHIGRLTSTKKVPPTAAIVLKLSIKSAIVLGLGVVVRWSEFMVMRNDIIK